ncbi:MAG TPA: SDR family oxidoreductase [Syntrophorhabdaceae bacterium]|nr:SDR family oxidoreductase [Syntrophorhabdaceae bacterium]
MGERLRDKVAIVTGAGTVPAPEGYDPVGNGRAAAITYASEGARVLAVDLNGPSADETRRLIEAEGGTCSAFEADVTVSDDCHSMVAQAIRLFGQVDILHNNVGIVPRNPGGILDADEKDWDLVMNVNVKSIFHTSRAVIPHMVACKRGVILTVSSLAAVRHGDPKMFIYTVSKAAVNSLTLSLAVEMADKGVRVNCIMPGMIDSPTIYHELLRFYGNDPERMRTERSQRIPMKRMGLPWDVARAALFLACDDAQYITGQILGVDGGLLALGG